MLARSLSKIIPERVLLFYVVCDTMVINGGLAERGSGRVVDGSGLENRHTRKGIVGSNPTFPAKKGAIWERLQ
jgi:hypothetical protein